MSKQGKSVPDLFGGYTHYDSNGKKIGHSSPGLFGGYTNYDAKGHKTGYSSPGIFGGYTSYDNKGHKIGHSSPGIFGGYTHYDEKGNKIGTTSPMLFGGGVHYDNGQNKSSQTTPPSGGSSGGCYIATCVYGSYDCPEVWTLRRFRDNTLASTWYGRAFIRTYYTISPTLVRWFGHTSIFQRFWKRYLNKLVSSLQENGVEDTPYQDKDYNIKRRT